MLSHSYLSVIYFIESRTGISPSQVISQARKRGIMEVCCIENHGFS